VDALSATVPSGGRFAVRAVTTPTLTKNPAFNGVADPNLLTRADVLQAGGSGNLAVNIGVEPGNIFRALLNADGTSVLGTTVRATASAGFAVYYFDIKPRTLSTSSECERDDDDDRGDTKGVCVLPAIVFSSRGVDAAQIDPASVRLIGVAPLRWSLVPSDGEHGESNARRGDDERGRSKDLKLKFDRSRILAALQGSLTVASLSPTTGSSASLIPGEGSSAVVLSAADAAVVARALLGENVTLSPAQLRAADRNGNGAIDVGDLRAALVTAASFQKGDTGNDSRKPPTPSRVLVLTGVLRDGTPFMGEDAVLIGSDRSDR
jgi:hypothetical protein